MSKEESIPVDNVTQVRDMLRKSSAVSVEEVMAALTLNKQVAAAVLRQAKLAEQETAAKYAREAEGPPPPPPPPPPAPAADPDFYLHDSVTNQVHKLSVRTESDKRVVFEFKEPNKTVAVQ